MSDTFLIRCLFGGIGLGVVLLGFAFTPDSTPGFLTCFFHELSGYPCPGCGLTRAICCIGHGDWVGAWSFNPFSFVFYAGAMGLVFGAVMYPYLPRGLCRRVEGWIFPGGCLLIVSMLVYGVWRIVSLGGVAG